MVTTRRSEVLLWAVVFMLIACGATLVASQAAPTAYYYYTNANQVNATVYDYTAYLGGCGYLDWDASDFDVSYTVGVSSTNFYNGEICGMCIEVTSVSEATDVYYNPIPFPKNKKFNVMVNNLGNNFAGWTYHLDFYIPTQYPGRWLIDWHAVECPTTNNIEWQVTKGSQSYYLQVLPVYQKINIHELCIYVNGWTAMTRAGNGAWNFDGQVIPDNPRVGAISVDGQLVVDTIPIVLSSYASGTPTTVLYKGDTPSNFGSLIEAGLTATPPSCASLATASNRPSGPPSKAPSKSPSKSPSKKKKKKKKKKG